jgi:NADP-dependent 3-hydroxy acid dehydrogenase YdfG
MKIAGKVLVVTGAGSGIGQAVAREAVRRGARVAAVDLNPDTLAATVSGSPAMSAHPLNVTDRDAVEALPGEVVQRWGTVDGYVHCAGIIQPFVRLKDLDYETIDRVFRVNWSGTLHLAKAFLPVLLARPEGHIVNVASMGGFLPVPGQTIYGASKAAVKLLTEGLHAECAGTGVRVTVVFPGGVATNITTNSGVAIPIDESVARKQAAKITTPERAAQDVLDGMAADAYRVLIGKDARLMDKLYRLNPRRSAALIAGKMQELLSR